MVTATDDCCGAAMCDADLFIERFRAVEASFFQRRAASEKVGENDGPAGVYVVSYE